MYGLHWLPEINTVMLMFGYVTLCAEWLEFTACYVCQVVCPELKVSMIRGVYHCKKRLVVCRRHAVVIRSLFWY